MRVGATSLTAPCIPSSRRARWTWRSGWSSGSRRWSGSSCAARASTYAPPCAGPRTPRPARTEGGSPERWPCGAWRRRRGVVAHLEEHAPVGRSARVAEVPIVTRLPAARLIRHELPPGRSGIRCDSTRSPSDRHEHVSGRPRRAGSGAGVLLRRSSYGSPTPANDGVLNVPNELSVHLTGWQGVLPTIFPFPLRDRAEFVSLPPAPPSQGRPTKVPGS